MLLVPRIYSFRRTTIRSRLPDTRRFPIANAPLALSATTCFFGDYRRFSKSSILSAWDIPIGPHAYYPDMILAGRPLYSRSSALSGSSSEKSWISTRQRFVGVRVAQECIRRLLRAGTRPDVVMVLGLTFKENVVDIRNSGRPRIFSIASRRLVKRNPDAFQDDA